MSKSYGLVTLKAGKLTKGPRNPNDTLVSKYQLVTHPSNRGDVVVDGNTLAAGTACDFTGCLHFMDLLAEEDGDRVFWTWKEK
jgi:hypothetical protein